MILFVSALEACFRYHAREKSRNGCGREKAICDEAATSQSSGRQENSFRKLLRNLQNVGGLFSCLISLLL